MLRDIEKQIVFVIRSLAVITCILLIAGCTAIKIESAGDAEPHLTDEEIQAQEMKSRWLDQFNEQRASAQGLMLKALIDSVAAHGLAFGLNIADEWKARNEEEGKPIPSDEIRRLHYFQLESQKPFQRAYSSMMQTALSRLIQTKAHDPSTLEAVEEYMRIYQQLSGTIQSPFGSEENFRKRLYEIQENFNSRRRDLQFDLERYPG